MLNTSWCRATSKNQAPCSSIQTNHPCIYSKYCFKFVLQCFNKQTNTVFNNSWITRNSQNTLLSVAKDAYSNNRSKSTLHTELSSQLFYSLSLVLFFRNSSNKASSLLFIFAYVSTGHTHFSNVPMRSSTVFLSCRTYGKQSVTKFQPTLKLRRYVEIIFRHNVEFGRDVKKLLLVPNSYYTHAWMLAKHVVAKCLQRRRF